MSCRSTDRRQRHGASLQSTDRRGFGSPEMRLRKDPWRTAPSSISSPSALVSCIRVAASFGAQLLVAAVGATNRATFLIQRDTRRSSPGVCVWVGVGVCDVRIMVLHIHMCLARPMSRPGPQPARWRSGRKPPQLVRHRYAIGQDNRRPQRPLVARPILLLPSCTRRTGQEDFAKRQNRQKRTQERASRDIPLWPFRNEKGQEKNHADSTVLSRNRNALFCRSVSAGGRLEVCWA